MYLFIYIQIAKEIDKLRINFYLLRTFCPHLSSLFYFYLFILFFLCFSSFTTFRPNFTSGFLQVIFTATSDRNDESCNRIPSNYCLPQLLSIAPRFWPNKPLASLGRIWNRYLLTMLTWNRRDSMPLSAAPRTPKDGFFGLINPYLVFYSRVRTEFL